MDNDGTQRAFLWEEGIGMQELSPLSGSTYAHATGINRIGQIVGSSGDHAVLWTKK